VAHTSVTEPIPAAGATPAQIEAVYRARHPQLLRVATAILGDPEAAHDAVQEGVARALRGRGGFRGTGPLDAWIWRAVVNAARSSRSRQVVQELPRAPAAAPDTHADSQLQGAVAALPERQRLAVFLRHYADLDYAAIAEALAITPGTVGATLSAAYASLRTSLEEADR
jgi:RNA polymerase sigma-70 factor (ECF subfamily)